ncbi:hypothetical protein [Bacillus sp. 1NLA3E]|uniref:hypothetical protein n=1 Tax=Bacillus sp. 1NLA3E TaxID=666686 RepID=UPI000247E3EF|nr:hypothetical protein [Bacillus sp. 1NLA3E]AGK53198.1 hypothetical protein B1NLA3E_07180 [Bacillus sp. 1NLA3E]
MKKKKVLLWGVIFAAVIFVFNLVHGLFDGHREFAGGQRGLGHGQAGMGQAGMDKASGFGQHGGFGGHHQLMNGSFHGESFPWLALLIGLVVLVLLVRWLRKRAKATSMNQFIDTSIVSTQTPIISQNASILDQWEKNVTNKKETE